MTTQNGHTNGADTSNGDGRGSLVIGQTIQGIEIRGVLIRLSRFLVVFEIYNPALVLRASEVLEQFKIIVDGRTVYSGRAVVSAMVNTGILIVCEAKLYEPGPETEIFLQPAEADFNLHRAYDRFFQKWQTAYCISPEFKVLVADVEAFLVGVRQWLEQVEFEMKARKDNAPAEQERGILEAVAPRVIEAFNAQHERFEELAAAIPLEQRGVHEDFVRRHWHRLFLCSPFGSRTYHKPLGYAGDYEMMNMIYRNQPEGGSLYEKLIHKLLVSQWPAQSVRNRFVHLKENIVQETARIARAGRRARILNIGCGPAQEIQEFLKETHLSDQADFTLLDFNEETLDHTNTRLAESKHRFGRRAGIETRRISVQQLIKRWAQEQLSPAEENYDLIYCAGLFDYLSGRTCRALVSLFYQSLRPGGLIMTANMNDTKPFRHFIEFVLDWQLFYRGGDEMRSFAPESGADSVSVVAEDASVNLFLHVRKPN